MSCYRHVPTKAASGKFKVFCVLFLFSNPLFAQSPILHIRGFKNENGKAFIRITNEEGKVVGTLTENIIRNEVRIALPLHKKGRFAVEVFHDENNNQKLDKAVLGYPTEAWGVSNNTRPKFRAPLLDEMLTDIDRNSEVSIFVK